MKSVVNIFDQASIALKRWEHGKHYGGLDGNINEGWGNKHLGFHVESLDPGRFGCPYHTHTHEEELMIVLEGEATIRQDGEFFKVKRGDLVFYKIGVFHQMYNHSDKPFYFFMLSNTSKSDECSYPDSRKKMADGKITQDGVEVTDYWKDEEDPRPHWPKEIIRND